jgi:hypothetical protein
MNPANLPFLLSRFMAPLIFDNDLFWPGCSEDAAYFAKNKRRMFRLRNSFEGEWSEFGGIFRSVLVIRLWSRGVRLRIGLCDVTHSNCPAWNEPVSDVGACEELTAELHHRVKSAKPSSVSGELA